MAGQARIMLEEAIQEAEAHPFEFRMSCLKLANLAQEITGDMNLGKVMERAERYWEFVLGMPSQEEITKAILQETDVEGSA